MLLYQNIMFIEVMYAIISELYIMFIEVMYAIISEYHVY